MVRFWIFKRFLKNLRSFTNIEIVHSKHLLFLHLSSFSTVLLDPTVHYRVFYIIYWIPLYTTGCSTSYIESLCTLQGVLHHILNRAFSSRLGNHDKISLNHLKQIQKFAFGKYTIFEHSIRKTIKFDMGHSVQNLLIKLGEKSIYERGLWLKKRIQ